VLHVLPHPGGGGERYVDMLAEIDGYRSERLYLTPGGGYGRARFLPRRVAATFVRARRHDLIHAHGEVAAAMCLPLLAARPSVVTLHGLHLVRRLAPSLRKAAELNVRAVVAVANRTICVSESERAELGRILGPSTLGTVSVVLNGVVIPDARDGRAARAELRRALGFDDAEVVAIWVGSLEKRKDPLTAVRGAMEASMPLLVVGDGPLRHTLQVQSGPRVRILGWRDDVARLLASSDVYVHTARREGLSLALLEAMAHRLAAVVADVPENVEAIAAAGVAVPPGDEAALAAALRRLAADPDERRALGASARARVEEVFDADTMVARTRGVYDEVLGERLI
jgi:glycosyltransferase involved in cell wall biosynthesis